MKYILQKNTVDIWQLDLDAHPDRLPHWANLLDAQEKTRANRFCRPQLQQRFTAAHGFLREVLAGYLGEPPEALVFNHGEHGKPFLATDFHLAGQRLEFNLSHSANQALLAVNLTHPIGVDIEKIQPDVEHLALAARFFAQAELAMLQAIPEKSDQINAFYQIWAQKEAFIKAIGLGLSYPLRDFQVTLAPHAENALVTAKPHSPHPLNFAIHKLPAPPNFATAIALVEVSDPTLKKQLQYIQYVADF